MHTSTMRIFAVAAASGTALGVLGLAGAGVSGAATAGTSAARSSSWQASRTAAVPGAQFWVRRYNGPANLDDFASSVAVSSSGGKVFVSGDSAGTTSRSDFATIAYDAATGARLWASRYNGPASGNDYDASMAVSPSGSMVFVTGRSRGRTSGDDYATVAYRAATGAQLWVSRYNGPANRGDGASAVAVSPSGDMVFVTGQSTGSTSGQDYATIAYSASTGAQLWIRRYNGPANGGDLAASVTVSPGGGTVYVTGRSRGRTSGDDYATIAYNTATGARLWVSRYNGPGSRFDRAAFVAAGPGGGKVFVTGESIGRTSGDDYATIAYNTATGARLWVSRYNGPANRDDVANSVAVSPRGGTVLVTGTSNSVGLDVFDARDVGAAVPTPDYATVAYSASTGARLWARRYNGPGNGLDFAYSVAVSPSGSRAFVTGFSIVAASYADYATIAYNTATGAQVWARRYNGPANRSDAGSSVAVSPGGNRVYVTGTSTGARSGQDYATIAYHS